MIQHYDLFENCKRGDAKAQRMLYDLFKGRLMGLCRRYAQSREEAQDVLQESFIKIFSKVGQLESVDKLESWMKAITVRTAIDQYHKTKTHDAFFSKMDGAEEMKSSHEITLHNFRDEEVMMLVNALPDGCRLVFNLFVVEGYTHSEIAGMMNISEGTSRSQLHHAKYLMREKLKGHTVAHYYEKLA
jgi:RNA polymerase sigma factor (sigma-70 family)